METAIRIANLRVDYGETPVLKGIDAEVGKGEIAVILGGSGCGKSTLLKTITGLIEPREGRVEVLGINTATLDEESQSELAKRLGVMFQYGALLNSLTVGENIALPLEMHTDLPLLRLKKLSACGWPAYLSRERRIACPANYRGHAQTSGTCSCNGG